MLNLAVLCTTPEFLAASQALAHRLSCPLLQDEVSLTDYCHILQYQKDGLSIRLPNQPALQTFTIDFTDGQTAKRLQAATVQNELIAKAFGLHKHAKTQVKPAVLDCTAGLGRDAMIVAMLGCQVDLIERSPVIHALLQDALLRAQATPFASRFSQAFKRTQLLECQEALDYLQQCKIPKYDIIYLDPMFAQANKTAKSQKAMQIFDSLLQTSQETGAAMATQVLFQACLNHSQQRLVVKRPRTADPLVAEPKPSHQVIGKANRFDVYLNR